MEQIKVTKVVSKTTSGGKPYKMLEVECQGEARRVNVWSNAPDFANIQEGSTIVGKMAMDGQYWFISFEGDKPRGGASGGYKTAQIEKAMEQKSASISKFQDNKEMSIKLASTLRMAVDLTIAQTNDQRETTFEETIRKWREWLWLEWDNTTSHTMPPF